MKIYNPFRPHVAIREESRGRITYSVRRWRWLNWEYLSFSGNTEDETWPAHWQQFGYTIEAWQKTEDPELARDLCKKIRTGWFHKMEKRKRRMSQGMPITNHELEKRIVHHKLQTAVPLGDE